MRARLFVMVYTVAFTVALVVVPVAMAGKKWG